MIGLGDLLNMFVENGKANKVENGNLNRSAIPQVVKVNSSLDLETLGELPAGSIAYDGTSTWQLTALGKWESVTVGTPQNGDTLVYNSSTGKWENGSGGGGGGAVKLTVTKTISGDANIYTLDKTWNEIKSLLEAGTQVVLCGEGTGNLAGYYLQFVVQILSEEDGIYYVANYAAAMFNGEDLAPITYEMAVLGVTGTLFNASSANGYPSISVANK